MLQHRVVPVLNPNEGTIDAVAIAFGAIREVMGAAISFQ